MVAFCEVILMRLLIWFVFRFGDGIIWLWSSVLKSFMLVYGRVCPIVLFLVKGRLEVLLRMLVLNSLKVALFVFVEWSRVVRANAIAR